ncbi:nitrilotriacetate monooxygenase component b [Fusarium sporotrichioides]|uniref:Nitrilotriacetate monooxygenase component b n=1 Tax=Fusarium sporotrichioides TaxID=5514 RepID=A0A395S493_FUSSP|nr:nitrilotriacetate monooxygenase component b [Fusarium sporotrichioides]
MSPSAKRLNSTAAAAVTKPAFSAVQPVTNFAEKIANRPAFDKYNKPIEVTKSPDPSWSYGDGVRTGETPPIDKVHKEIDPYSPDRSVSQNYRLLISGIAPRPIGFISTISKDGKTKNLAPFSYFQMVDHDPPMFMVSFSSRHGRIKDTYQNMKDTKECVINTVSENMIEAVNASSIDAPYGISEWDVTGLTEAETTTVKPSRVKESVLSIEGKVVDMKEFQGHKPGMSGSAIFLVEATRLWVQEDAANDDFSHIELDKLRPIAQLGGMSYGRVTSTFELPRTRWVDEQPKSQLLTELESNIE